MTNSKLLSFFMVSILANLTLTSYAMEKEKEKETTESSQSKTISLSDLPDEVLHIISSELSIKDNLAVTSTCKKLYKHFVCPDTINLHICKPPKLECCCCCDKDNFKIEMTYSTKKQFRDDLLKTLRIFCLKRYKKNNLYITLQNGFEDKEISDIFRIISNHPVALRVVGINLSYNRNERLTDFLRTLTNITTLTLDSFDPFGNNLMKDVINNCPNLEEISLNQNTINDESIIKGFQGLKKLKRLHLEAFFTEGAFDSNHPIITHETIKLLLQHLPQVQIFLGNAYNKLPKDLKANPRLTDYEDFPDCDDNDSCSDCDCEYCKQENNDQSSSDMTTQNK